MDHRTAPQLGFTVARNHDDGDGEAVALDHEKGAS